MRKLNGRYTGKKKAGREKREKHFWGSLREGMVWLENEKWFHISRSNRVGKEGRSKNEAAQECPVNLSNTMGLYPKANWGL